MSMFKKLACILGWRKAEPKAEPIDPDDLCYIYGLDYSLIYAELNPNNCAVIERTGDGESVGPCCFYLKDGVTCPRHGTVKEEI